MLRSFILFAGLILALGLAGCPQQADQPATDTEVTEGQAGTDEATTDDNADAPADSGDDTDGGEDAGDDDTDSGSDDNSGGDGGY